MTTDGRKESQTGNQDMAKDHEVKRWRDDIVQMKGITWGRDAEQRDDWRRDAEGYILQWMDGASV